MTPHPSALTGDMLIPLAERLKTALETVTALIQCRDCGSGQDVQIIPTGSLGKLTPLCPACLKALQNGTKQYWEQHEKTHPMIQKRLSFLSRLFAAAKIQRTV